MRYHVSQPSLGPSELRLVTQTIEANRLTQGAMVERFESALADYLGVAHAVAVTNGTAALHLALAALGIGPGDEVIVPDLTFIATANAVRYTGATPVLVDVNPFDWNLEPHRVEQAITKRTRAIVPVHLYGVPCHMDPINLIAAMHGLYVVEDAAEGLGGYYKSEALGTLADAGTFSFYGNKIITTGEGGAVVTNNPFLADHLRLLRGQGQSAHERYYHVVTGFNYRMTEMQAALGVGQMEGLDERIEKRQRVCDTYRLCLPDRYLTQHVQGCDEQAPWLFTCLLPASCNDVEYVSERLAAEGIETRRVFVPLHTMPMFEHCDRPNNATMIRRYGISLPTHPGLTQDDARYIAGRLRAYAEGR